MRAIDRAACNEGLVTAGSPWWLAGSIYFTTRARTAIVPYPATRTFGRLAEETYVDIGSNTCIFYTYNCARTGACVVGFCINYPWWIKVRPRARTYCICVQYNIVRDLAIINNISGTGDIGFHPFATRVREACQACKVYYTKYISTTHYSTQYALLFAVSFYPFDVYQIICVVIAYTSHKKNLYRQYACIEILWKRFFFLLLF